MFTDRRAIFIFHYLEVIEKLSWPNQFVIIIIIIIIYLFINSRDQVTERSYYILHLEKNLRIVTVIIS